MEQIDRLKRALNQVTRFRLAGLALADDSRLQKDAPNLLAFAGEGDGLERPDTDTLASAARAYRKTERVENVAQARVLCYGCTAELDAEKLIESPPFTQLLNYVDRYHLNPRPFRRCYRALLDAYFVYDPEDARASDQGKQSWRTLRTFLERRKNWLESARAAPAWVSVLLDHRNLLTPEPATRYAMATLEGNYAVFDALRARLAIAHDAWLARRLAMAQVQAAVELTDAHFKSAIERLLASLAKHPQVRDQGLRMVIDRFAASADVEVYPELRDFAVTSWGLPAQPLQASRWVELNARAREMMRLWL
ncbi:MAG: EH signature domain-containing protein [Pseudomonadota bacterium]